MTPQLSLCLPTYKRAALLGGALRAVLEQVTPDLAPYIEVFVVDNASPDETPAVVQKAQEDFPHVHIRYLRRPENIGPDASFCGAVFEARGEFVYLLSDDDVLLPGAVAKLLELITAYPGFDAFALNVREFHRDALAETGTPVAFTLPGGAESLVCTDRDQALSLLKVHITFLSCIAFRRSNVLGYDYSPFRGTIIAQAFLFLDALAPGRGMCATRQPFLARREGNNEGFGFFQVFVTTFQTLMVHARRRGYSKETVRAVLRHDLEYVYHCLLIFKSGGRYGKLQLTYLDSLWTVARLLRAFGPDRLVLLQIVPRLLVPGAVFGPLQRAYTRAKGRRGRRV